MDASLSNALGSGNPAADFRNEDDYYARNAALWPRAARKPFRSDAPGFRAIATTFAVIILYCVLVPYAPAVLFS